MEAKLADKEYFSIKEFKNRLGVSSNLVYEQLRKGILPSVHLGGRILIPADALQQLMLRLVCNTTLQNVLQPLWKERYEVSENKMQRGFG